MSKYCSETGLSHSNHTASFCPDCGISLQSYTSSSSTTRRTTEKTDPVVIDLVDSPIHQSQFIPSQTNRTKPIQTLQQSRTTAAIARTESIQQTRKTSQKEVSINLNCVRVRNVEEVDGIIRYKKHDTVRTYIYILCINLTSKIGQSLLKLVNSPFSNISSLITDVLLPPILVRLEEINMIKSKYQHKLAHDINKDGPVYIAVNEEECRTIFNFIDTYFAKGKGGIYQVYLLFEETLLDDTNEIDDPILFPSKSRTKEEDTKSIKKEPSRTIKQERRKAIKEEIDQDEIGQEEIDEEGIDEEEIDSEEIELDNMNNLLSRTTHKRAFSQLSIVDEQPPNTRGTTSDYTLRPRTQRGQGGERGRRGGRRGRRA